jgi:hypothetical protein
MNPQGPHDVSGISDRRRAIADRATCGHARSERPWDVTMRSTCPHDTAVDACSDETSSRRHSTSPASLRS